VSPTIAGIANPVTGAGSVTAPGAGGSLIGGPVNTPAGTYDVEIDAALTGTAETIANQIGLFVNGVLFAKITNPSQGSPPRSFSGVVVPSTTGPGGGGTLDVRAIGAATAGAVYSVVLLAQLSRS
jgi:hypothetical protein